MAKRGGFPGGMGMPGNMNNLMKLKLAEEVVDPDDVEMLEDLIMAATNEALRKMEAETQAVMSKLTGGLGGGFPF